MFLSVFDLFKIGIGPSSSHTIGPMVAAHRFLEKIRTHAPFREGTLSVTLYGSLAFTGKGHATDRAIILGLAGELPDRIDPEKIESILTRVTERGKILIWPKDDGWVNFDPSKDLVFDYGPTLKSHSNGMIFYLKNEDGLEIARETYYSIGGGFVQTESERLVALSQSDRKPTMQPTVAYPFVNSLEMLEMGKKSGLSIVAMKQKNESFYRQDQEIDRGLDLIWETMDCCIQRGLNQSGYLPGRLKVKRRAHEIFTKLKSEQGNNATQPHRVLDFLSVYAMAVNEENAAGSKVVTAPTNGAAGVIPAVIRYYLDHCVDANQAGVRSFLLAAAAIGGIIKHNASISGAEVGCQGEVGSASAMAAAGLCAALGGSNEQIENAAEIALEHHLGMTCDPVGGLVQVPCIERNAFGAVKAVTAASLALRGDGVHLVSLDACIETMRQTGIDMSERYKETSTGGLAVNVVEC